MEEASPLEPRPYDPERWLRRWTTLWGVLLAAVILVPTYMPPGWIAPQRTGWAWEWEFALPTTWPGLKAFLPHLFGLVAVVAVRRMRGKARAVFVALAALLDVALSVQRLVDAAFMEWPIDYVVLAVANAFLLPLAAATAATAHVTRRYPAASSMRRRSRVIGFVFAVFMLGILIPLLATGFPSASRGLVRLIWLLPFAGAIAYGAACGLRFRGKAEAVRSRCVALSSRLALPVWAAGVSVASAVMRSRVETLSFPEPATFLAQLTRHMGVVGAPFALGALAIAAWVEPSLRGLLPPDASVLEPIFE